MVSVAAERGKIVSAKTARMARFFGFRDAKEFAAAGNNIRAYMPEFIAKLHDRLIGRVIQRGSSAMIKSSKTVFYQTRALYLQPAKLYLEHCFGFYDDFCLMATMLRLENQGDFIAFNRQGRVVGIT